MKVVKVSDLFNVQYGINLELINLEECQKREKNSISFVSRTEKNNGISAFVTKDDTIVPNPANTISVAGGGSVLSTFYQFEEYYSGRDVYILIPKKDYSIEKMLFYAYCIRKNKYRYNYGRQANKTLKDILIPEEMPHDWQELNCEQLNELKCQPLNRDQIEIDTSNWKWFKLSQLFTVTASRDELSINLNEGGSTPYITSSEVNNGISAYFSEEPTNKAGTITANRGGSVGYFFYQPFDYLATPVDVRILTPTFKINPYIGLFIKTILQIEKYRYNYSRKMGTDRLEKLVVKLPSSKKNEPDWDFMENYIKSIEYSKNIL